MVTDAVSAEHCAWKKEESHMSAIKPLFEGEKMTPFLFYFRVNCFFKVSLTIEHSVNSVNQWIIFKNKRAVNRQSVNSPSQAEQQYSNDSS